MLNFLILMLVPMAIAFGILYFYRREVHVWEFVAQMAIPAALVVLGLALCYWQNTTDIEVWNGRVVRKAMEKVSCSHSYKCHCYTSCSGTGNNRSCHEVCSTCYEHSYDVDWAVYASEGSRLEIDRIDRQGVKMPPRWGTVFVGEPFASSHYYTNYIMANPESVLLGGKGDMQKFGPLIPQYPSGISDYYRAQHVINVGGHVPVQNVAAWEWLLDELNGDLGPVKQVNVLVLFVKTADPAYTLALKDAWIGGKKNDVVVVFGSLDGKKMDFVDILSWTPKYIYKVELRDALYKIGNLDERDAIVSTIKNVTMSKFERMHMKDFKYLMRSFQPSNTAMIVLFILGTILSIGLAVYVIKNDIDSEGRVRYNPYRYRY